MTEHPKLPDIVEHLREAIREGAGQLAEDCIEEITRLRSLVEQADADADEAESIRDEAIAEAVRLRSRLEMDGVWQLIDGKMQRISVEPGSIPDGIECRDETIKLQDAEIARLRLRSPAPAEKRAGQVYATWCEQCPYEGGCGNCQFSPAPAEDGEGLREALKQIALITASGRTTELLAKMAQINALARAALSSGRDGGKT